MSRLLAIGAHPDDVEFGLGLTIIDAVADGDSVDVCVVTSGEAGRSGSDGDSKAWTAQVREAEAREAADVLGVSNVYFLRCTDGSLSSDHHLRDALHGLFAQAKYEVVYTHWLQDQHLDHEVVAKEAVSAALRFAPNVICYESPFSANFSPNLYHLSDQDALERKLAALAVHGSQSHWRLPQLARSRSQVGGHEIHHNLASLGVDTSERFVQIRAVRSARERLAGPVAAT